MDPDRTRSTRAALVALLVALAVLALGGVADRLYFANGVTAVFFQTHQGERFETTRTVEHRVVFESQHRPLSRYVQDWPHERMPLPERIPPFDVLVRARVQVREGGPRFFGARTQDEAEVTIDGAAIPADGVAPGDHELAVHWTGRFGPRTGLELLWGHGPELLEPIPRDELRPVVASTARTWWWIVVALCALAFGGLALAAARTEGPRRRRAIHLALGLGIVLVGLAYRGFDYDVMPEFRENPDELFAMWDGWSILEDGTTRGWTMWPGAYAGLVEVERIEPWGIEEHVITPYFEHPPGLHLLVGIANQLAGTDAWIEVRLRDGRIVAILLGLVALALTLLVARRLAPSGPGAWIGALLYATVPFIALQTRVIKEEALLTPLAMGALYAFLRWRDGGYRRRWLVLAAVCAGLGPFAKVPGAAYVIALVMLILMERRTRDAWIAGAIGLALATLFPLWGAIVDWGAFVATQVQQGTRPMHFNIFARWFDDPLINHNLVGRGWLIFLWLGTMAALATRGRRDAAVLALPLVLYMLAISVGSGNWTFGWYATPFYPLLCIGAGLFLAQVWEKPTLLGGALFVAVFLFYSLNFTVDVAWAKQHDAWPVLRRAVSVLLAVSLAPFCLAQVWDLPVYRRLSRGVLVAGLASFVVLAGVFVARYDIYYDAYRNFDRDAFFDR